MTDTPPRRIRYVPLSQVAEADLNPKDHDLDMVVGSIRRFGFVDGAVHDGRTDQIIAGHGRLAALRRMRDAGENAPEGVIPGVDGEWLMPVQEGWSSRSDAEALALLVQLNKATEAGGWNPAELEQALAALKAEDDELFRASGFVDAELDALRAQLAEEDYQSRDPESLDDAPPPPVHPYSKPGDVWLLGVHRVVCGSATVAGDVDTALHGAPAGMVFTDPPYGVAYESKAGRLLNDDLAAEKLRTDLLTPAFAVIREHLAPGGAFYVCSPSGDLETQFRLALRDAGLRMRQQIVWVKDALVLGRQDYHLQHETIHFGWDGDEAPVVPPYDVEHDTVLYGWRDGAAHQFPGGRKQTSVWQFPRPRRSDLHPTMKPVPLCRRAILNSSQPGQLVLDTFGGSGSTLIACELSARPAALVELDPRFVDVICLRWQQLTGRLPVHAGTGEEHDFSADAGHADAPPSVPVEEPTTVGA